MEHTTLVILILVCIHVLVISISNLLSLTHPRIQRHKNEKRKRKQNKTETLEWATIQSSPHKNWTPVRTTSSSLLISFSYSFFNFLYNHLFALFSLWNTWLGSEPISCAARTYKSGWACVSLFLSSHIICFILIGPAHRSNLVQINWY